MTRKSSKKSSSLNVVLDRQVVAEARQTPVVYGLDTEVTTTASSPPRLITKQELRQIIPYTGQHILRLEKQGKFPRRIRVGANRVAWLLLEIEAWIAARVAERDCINR